MEKSKHSDVHDQSESWKLAHGKVENTALPETYISKKLEFDEFPATKIDFEQENLILMTTIPAGEDDPDGHSEWMVLGPTKRKVLTAPGYPKRPPQPRVPNLCVVKETESMGLGLFATADIKAGELILSERPLIVYPRVFGLPIDLDEEMLSKYSRRELEKIAMHEREKQLECAVGRMSEADQKAYKSLYNSHTEDGSGPLLGVLRTNGYSTDLHDGLVMTETNRYCALGRLGSRINHSCRPNVVTSFEIPSFSIQYIALHDIKASDQLFYSYCGLRQSVAERRLELEPYGFVCTCLACKNATPERDMLRKNDERNVAIPAVQAPEIIKLPQMSGFFML